MTSKFLTRDSHTLRQTLLMTQAIFPSKKFPEIRMNPDPERRLRRYQNFEYQLID
ncbi:15987_t:CDS:2 [Funneliformis caledonium]|uniref:15987_t:CDS:1 n=1 Tax=Funneliformis caledonium TaxID=1117310 RepID=A0A9N9G3H8_9GLOM|nr:15987_t:CDS:2 [Funneliformis caledonium]